MKPYLRAWARAAVGPLAVLTALVCAAPPGTTAAVKPPAPQAPIRFGVEVRFVEVYAVVTDRRDRFVSSLRPEDFEVFEYGKPQEISSLNLVDVPIERRDPVLFSGPPEPGVRSSTQVSEGRVFAMVLDNLHTAPERSQRVTRAVHEFIDHRMGADDIALVAHAGGKGRPYQFISDKHSLRRASEGFTGRALRPAVLTILEESQWASFRTRPDTRPTKSSAGASPSSGSRGGEAGRGIWDPYEAERVQRASAALHVVEGLAKLLTEVPRRRKAIVYFGEGISYNIHPRAPGDRGLRGSPAPGRDTVRDSIRQAIRAAKRANVAVYAIDPRGLGGSGQFCDGRV